MTINNEQWLFNVGPKTRWTFIVLFFILIVALDFSTPPQYILAYLYIIPILISISFLKPKMSKKLLAIAIFATLMNLVWPHNVLNDPAIVVSRLLSVLAVSVSAFFMVRYSHYQQQLKEQESILVAERNLAQMREDFIATLTHDLKTPLLGGQQTLDYLNKGAFGALNDEQKNVVEALQRSTHRQLDMVQTLLSAYKIDNVGAELVLTPVNMDELIADILSELQYLAIERNITLDYFCKKTPPSIKGDSIQLKRVIANLVHNALNYTPSEGHVQVQLWEHSGDLIVEVSDTGAGIPESNMKSIFNRFYHSGSNREVISTGLGLYLSRQIITAHRGRIWAENLAPEGCKFTFSLPIAAGTKEQQHG